MAWLYLIRHAQSLNNQNWSGSDLHPDRHPDPEITEKGHAQAVVLANHLSDPNAEPRQFPFQAGKNTRFGITHLYCSLMTRSILTAEYVAKACGLALHAHPDFFEKYGIYEFDSAQNRIGLPGPARDYFEGRFPSLKIPESVGSAGWWNRPAEDEEAFIKRMRAVVAELKDRLSASDENVALVAHGDFIDQFINELMGVDRHAHNYANHWVANWAFHNTSISRIDFVDGAHNVIYLNRIDHLPTELITW